MIKRILVSLIAITVIAIIGLYATGHKYIITSFKRTYMVGNTTANINDYQQFDIANVSSKNAKELEKHANYNSVPFDAEFEKYLTDYKTAAFLIIKDGKVISENYYLGYNDRSKTNSFSMAKTVTTLLVGIAIKEGHINSIDQPLTDFLPEFKSDPLAKSATLAHLSLMNSGYEWDENYYSPFSPTVQLYHGSNIEKFLLSRSFSDNPGSFWEYSSASTQLLGIALVRALKKAGVADSLSEYLSKKIWQPLQMNDDAPWHTDDMGTELTYCCLNTNARNYAKLGLLMLHKGRWNGQQIVPSDFIDLMVSPKARPYYGYSTWLSYDHDPAFYSFDGHLGQYILVVPEHNVIIVRLGETREKTDERHSPELSKYINAAVEIIKEAAN